MSIEWWIASYVTDLAFWFWIVRWGGAELLEDSFLAGFFDWLHWRMSAESMRLLGWIAIAASTAWFGIGCFVPAARFWL